MAWYNRSLERHTAWHCGLTLLLLTALCLGISLYWPYWWIWLGSLIALGLGNRWLWAGRQQQLAAFRRASIQLDALKLQDYSLQAKPAYSQGVVAECQQQLQQLSAQLQQRKSFFDEQQFLLYRLIDQLNTPILVLNHKQQLSYANADFQHLFGQPWQSLRHCSAASLGLTDQPQWQFVASPLSQQWQIRHSRFLDQGDRYQLLVFIDIQSALRESQLQAWQQLIRVLSHEIRNSLTPVQSLAEYLQQKLPAGREQEALTLIRERSQHLQDFVSRYAKLNQPLTVNWQAVDAKALAQGLQLLYPQNELKLEVAALTFLSDPALLQQLLINLLKNAIEAGSPPGTMVMNIRRQQDWLWLTLKDEGHGVLNPADLFVPFYSTKAQGQGIGLALCRQIAQSLGGEISLQNRSDGISGSEAHLKLPWRSAT